MLSSYSEDSLYPYRYYEISPVSGSFLDSDTITISFTYKHYSGWTSPKIDSVSFVQVWFYDANGNMLAYENASAYVSTSISGTSGSATINLAKCTNSYKSTAASIGILIETETSGKNANGVSIYGTVPVANSSLNVPTFTLTHYTACTGPSWCSLDEDLSRDAVTLRWGAGTPGTNNPIDHYEVWRAEMASPDAAYPEDWEFVGSTGKTSMNVDPPDTVGRYYLFSVWAVGANYHENADSEWCDSSNLLRRKWDAFGAWTDATLTAGVSGIRAVHLTQLQERIAVIRAFYGLSAHSFKAVTARKTKIAKWKSLIVELRIAVDGITTNHAAWNTLEAGKPRIAHITQLRDIIDNM